MRCRHVVLFVLGSCVLLMEGRARAQGARGVGASTPLPLVVDLKKVPVGSWSEYRVSDGSNTMSIRMALVARTARAVNVETRIKGGPVAALGGSTVRMSLPLGAAAEVKPSEQVIQLGDHPPMLLPINVGGAGAQVFKKLDPQKRVGVDKVVVAGGTFARADHHQEKGPAGETIDFWTSAKILPFGLLKVASTSGGGGGGVGGGAAVTMELTAHGGGAKPEITKTPQPFDAAALMKQAQPAMVGGGDGAAASGKGGPPMRPIPSPHPGMPPTPPGSKAGSPSAAAPALAPALVPAPAPAKSPPGGKNTKAEK